MYLAEIVKVNYYQNIINNENLLFIITFSKKFLVMFSSLNICKFINIMK